MSSVSSLATVRSHVTLALERGSTVYYRFQLYIVPGPHHVTEGGRTYAQGEVGTIGYQMPISFSKAHHMPVVATGMQKIFPEPNYYPPH